MTSLLRRFPNHIWFIQFVLLIATLFIGLVFYPDPDPPQGIGTGGVVGHDPVKGFPQREAPVPARRPKRARSDTRAEAVYEVGQTLNGTALGW